MKNVPEISIFSIINLGQTHTKLSAKMKFVNSVLTMLAKSRLQKTNINCWKTNTNYFLKIIEL